MSKQRQAGFAVLEAVLIVIIVAIVGFAGYKVYQANQDSNSTIEETTQNVSSGTVATDVATAPAVKTASDLDEALQTLDETDPSGSNVTDADAMAAEVATF